MHGTGNLLIPVSFMHQVPNIDLADDDEEEIQSAGDSAGEDESVEGDGADAEEDEPSEEEPEGTAHACTGTN